jgi:hypothetical protein
MKKKTEKDTWYEDDEKAWNAAAKALRDDGWTQKPHQYRNATFHKNNKVVVLVRTLGVLNWHPTEYDMAETTYEN